MANEICGDYFVSKLNYNLVCLLDLMGNYFSQSNSQESLFIMRKGLIK